MNQLTTKGIVLSRTNYGEADRIITLLTPDHGKLSVMARGVRKPKSKLAGGIELFSVSSLTYIKGRGDLGTLMSARLDAHYGDIVKHIDRVQLGYELIKLINKVTEDEPESDYFELLELAFRALNTPLLPAPLIKLWFMAGLLRIGGHSPNLHTDTSGNALEHDARYVFDFENVAFEPRSQGSFIADHIKFLRLLFSGNEPQILAAVQGGNGLADHIAPIVESLAASQLRP